MRTMRRSAGRALRLLAVLGLSACASAGTAGSGSGGGGSTTLLVENNIIPSTSVRIHAVAPSGARTLVGSVNPGSSAALRFEPVGGGTTYLFVAEIPLGPELRSNPVSFSRGETIEWDLRSNIAGVANPD